MILSQTNATNFATIFLYPEKPGKQIIQLWIK